MRRRFVAYFYFTNWNQISFGVSLDLAHPTIELHIPTGFIRIGWQTCAMTKEARERIIGFSMRHRCFGWDPESRPCEG